MKDGAGFGGSDAGWLDNITFPPNGLATHTVTPSAGANGSLTPATPQTVNHGFTTQFTVSPASNYHIDTVNGCGGSLVDSTYTTGAVTADCSVTASFAINQYTLTYTAGANGSITGNTSQTVNHGSNGTPVTAVPATGYHFLNWSDFSTDNPRTDANVMANISVTANFAINTYTLTYTAGANGTITGTSPQTVNHGSNGTAVTAVPNTGYHFTQWSDGILTVSRTDANVTADISVTANFAINTYTLSYTAGANGTITGTSPQPVNYNASGTAVTAVPATGYHFVNWSDSSTANPRTDVNVTGNISVTANFAINTYTLTYTAGANGSITGTSPQTVNHEASGTAVTAVPSTGYHFVNWSDASTANPRTDANVTGNISVTSNFAINTYTLTYTAGANGTITGTSPQTVIYGANGTAVTAVPDPGYRFVQWSDASTANPRTDTNATANISVTADFSMITPDEDFETGNLSKFPWLTGGNGVWFVQTAFKHNGNYAAQSPALADSQSSHLEVTLDVTSAGTVSFWHKVSSAAGDSLIFSIDGLEQQRWSGEIDWAYDGYPVSATGVHTFRWEYVKDGTGFGGSDAAWMDNITFPPNALVIYTVTATPGGNGSLDASTPSPATVNYGWTTSFKFDADANYHVASVSGCGGTPYSTTSNTVGSYTFATGAITSDCQVSANFAVNSYTLTYTAGANGSIAGTSPQTVNYGANGTAVTAVPSTGYHFVNWSDSSTANPRTDTNVTGNISVTANFAINQYTLTYTAGSNGTITGTSPQTVNYGATGTAVTAIPATGYHFVNWSDASTSNPRTDANVTGNISVTATFAINTYTLTYTAGTNGTITGTSPQTVNHGANGTAVTAVPDPGYRFVQWSDDSTANPRTETNVRANISVAAGFAMITPDEDFETGNLLKLPWLTGGHGAWFVQNQEKHNGAFAAQSPTLGNNESSYLEVTLDVTSAGTVSFWHKISSEAGDDLIFTIDGVEQERWSGEADWAYDGYPVNAPGIHTFRWEYVKDGAGSAGSDAAWLDNITFPPYALASYMVTPTAGANGSLTPATAQTVNHGFTIQFTVTPDPNYHINTVSGCGGSLVDSTYTTGAVTADCSVVASFSINQYTLTYSAGANGSITGNISQTVNHGTSGTVVTAVPNTGYHFVSWSDSSTSNPRTDTSVTGNISVTANFAINTYTLTYTAGSNGTITGTSPQTVNHGANGAAVTAVPNTGYHFTQWSDGVLTASRTDLNVTTDISVTASFAINTYTLTYNAGANGTISGNSTQTVNFGGSGSAVTAAPNTGCRFVQWSDGVLDALSIGQ